MEIENNNNKGEKTNTKIEDTYRMTITKVAENSIKELLDKVNEEFEGGTVNRSQLASWILIKYSDNATQEDIKIIRLDHLNDFALFEHHFKKAKESGQIPGEMRDLIRRLSGIEEAPRKTPKKILQKNIINDDISVNGGRDEKA